MLNSSDLVKDTSLDAAAVLNLRGVKTNSLKLKPKQQLNAAVREARILRPPVMHFLRVLIPDHHQLPLRSVFPEVWRNRELIVETTGERREERDAENSN